jgi:hypothetical protein
MRLRSLASGMMESPAFPVTRRIDPLLAVKLLHTIVWAFLAGCIFALPVAGFTHHFEWAVVLTAIIVIECSVLALNDGRCPLTHVAARFTDKRTDNFDIYLPNWLARHNKRSSARFLSSTK